MVLFRGLEDTYGQVEEMRNRERAVCAGRSSRDARSAPLYTLLVYVYLVIGFSEIRRIRESGHRRSGRLR